MACEYVNSALELDTIGSKSQELLAVSVRNAWKGYGLIGKITPVLKGLNMSVKPGSIYALLGPSGCGKTTLLSCIVARQKLNQGTISVYGHVPGTRDSGVPGWRVGYMPQDLALYKECTINEMFSFFGRIYNMTSKNIKNQLKFLTELLEIPKHSRRLKTLSVGQQRRVSFALTLIHDPQLLILDEPTVGVDPMLRAKIWKFLLGKAESGLHTIIITTHYIEEARQADMVGMLHAGHLLVEKPPNYLLEKHNVSTLEDIFYKYCVDYETHGTLTIEDDDNYSTEQMAREIGPKSNLLKQFQSRDETVFERICHSFNRISSVYSRAYGRLLGNPILCLFMVLVPPAIIASFVFAFSLKVKGLHVAVHNGEYPNEQLCQFSKEECAFSNISCRILDALDTELLDLKLYPNASAAEDALDGGEVRAAIIFPANFSNSLMNMMFTSGFGDFKELSVRGMSNSSKFVLLFDQSHFAISAFILRSLFTTAMEFVKSTLSVCGMDASLADLPLIFRNPMPENFNEAFVDFLMGPLIICICIVVAALFAIVHFIADRQEGVLDRIAVTGVTALELIVGLALHQFTNILLQLISMLVVAFGIYHSPCNSGITGIFILCALQGACGLAFGFMVAVSFHDEKVAFMFLISLFYTVALFGGFVWPVEALPYFIRVISQCVPTTWATDSVRYLMLKDWGIAYKLVWPGFAISAAWTVVFITLTYISLKTINKF